MRLAIVIVEIVGSSGVEEEEDWKRNKVGARQQGGNDSKNAYESVPNG